MTRLREHLSYANVTATIAVFLALGGTSYAVLHIGSGDVTDNSLRSRDVRDNTLRSRDVRNHTLRARDLRRNGLGGGVIKESTLGMVPGAANAERLGGATAQDLRLRCPADTVAQAGVCIETSPRSHDGFLGATDRCDQASRGLVTMPQLDRFARTRGPLPENEWTGSVYRNAADAGLDQFEAIVLAGGGNPTFDKVYTPVQHAFRCVALPSN